MSGGYEVLSMKEDDVTKILAAGAHLGDSNTDFQMASYIFKTKTDGTPIINIRKTWEKLLFAARVIAAIENPSDVCVLSNKPYGQRAILKFAHYTGAFPIAGRFTPGTFTNQIQKAFREPRLLVVSDARSDHQPITEAAYVNIPVIAFCNSSSPLRYIDVAIPCNNLGKQSLGLMWWLLCREVLRLRATISRELPWEVMPDLFFYRDPEEVEKEEQAKAEAEKMAVEQWPATTTVQDSDQWADTVGVPSAGDWGDEPTVPPTVAAPPTAPATTAATTPAATTTTFNQDDWMGGAGTTTTKDWGADDGGDWGAAEPQASSGNW